MDMSVAPLMDQLNVDDWPFSMVDGSAVKLLMAGLITGAGGVGLEAGGGGGGGGTFFLHPGASTNNVSTSSVAPILEACDLSLALILNNLLFFKSTEFLYSKQASHYYLVS
jgi:hypothetical protein